MLIFGRILFGVGVGFGNETVPLFLTEVAPIQHFLLSLTRLVEGGNEEQGKASLMKIIGVGDVEAEL
ncbi:hypothetical protein RDI58_004311 [Solanum bulbocastanum]|uniref:Uncharacterized protein n=1 Tax=Solanum bulbocastanum TaxID=147425 RepID=A0AAN8TYV3_SOLBU